MKAPGQSLTVDAASRALTRLLRIAAGGALAFLAFPHFSGMTGIGGVPSSEWSPSLIASAALQGALVIATVSLCLWIAFGSSRRSARH